jgi:hypothetical protein
LRHAQAAIAARLALDAEDKRLAALQLEEAERLAAEKIAADRAAQNLLLAAQTLPASAPLASPTSPGSVHQGRPLLQVSTDTDDLIVSPVSAFSLASESLRLRPSRSRASKGITVEIPSPGNTDSPLWQAEDRLPTSPQASVISSRASDGLATNRSAFSIYDGEEEARPRRKHRVTWATHEQSSASPNPYGDSVGHERNFGSLPEPVYGDHLASQNPTTASANPIRLEIHNYGAYSRGPVVSAPAKRRGKPAGRSAEASQDYNININTNSGHSEQPVTYIPAPAYAPPTVDTPFIPRRRVGFFESFMSHLTDGSTLSETLQSLGKALVYTALSLMVLSMFGIPVIPILGFIITGLFTASAPLTTCFAIGAAGFCAFKLVQAYSDAKNDMRDQKAYDDAITSFKYDSNQEAPTAPRPHQHRAHDIFR